MALWVMAYPLRGNPVWLNHAAPGLVAPCLYPTLALALYGLACALRGLFSWFALGSRLLDPVQISA